MLAHRSKDCVISAIRVNLAWLRGGERERERGGEREREGGREGEGERERE